MKHFNMHAFLIQEGLITLTSALPKFLDTSEFQIQTNEIEYQLQIQTPIQNPSRDIAKLAFLIDTRQQDCNYYWCQLEIVDSYRATYLYTTQSFYFIKRGNGWISEYWDSFLRLKEGLRGDYWEKLWYEEIRILKS